MMEEKRGERDRRWGRKGTDILRKKKRDGGGGVTEKGVNEEERGT